MPASTAVSLIESIPLELLHLIVEFLPAHCAWRLALANTRLRDSIEPHILGTSRLNRRHDLLVAAARFNFHHLMTTALSYGPPNTTLTAGIVMHYNYHTVDGYRRPWGYMQIVEELFPASTLYIALTNGSPRESVPMIRALLAQGTDDCTSQFWRNKYLMEHRVNLAERTPLHMVDDIRLLAILLEPGSNCRQYINTYSYSRYMTPLATAIATFRSPDFIRMLLEAGANPNGPFLPNATDQQVADAYAQEGIEEGSRYKGPLELDFDQHWIAHIPMDTFELTHFEMACLFGQLKTAALVLNAGARIFDCTRRNGPLRALESALRANSRNEDQETALAFVDLFIVNGLEITRRTPLIMASLWFVSEAVFMRLLAWGANPMVLYQGPRGLTSLVRHLATVPAVFGLSGSQAIRTTRLRADKANDLLIFGVTADDEEGLCRQWAVEEGMYLLEWGFQIGFIKPWRRLSAAMAVDGIQEVFAQSIRHIPIWPSLLFSTKEECIYAGTFSVTTEIVHILLRNGVSVDRDWRGLTPLHYALRIVRRPMQPAYWSFIMPDVDQETMDKIADWRAAVQMQPAAVDPVARMDFSYLEARRDDNMVRIIRAFIGAGVDMKALDSSGRNAAAYAELFGWGNVWHRALLEEREDREGREA
ncbi:hypothetical protein ACHAQH_008665 [Verticillium albo-atrum]